MSRIAVLLLLPAVLALAGCPSAANRAFGTTPLTPDVPVSSPTGLYSLTVPDHNWLQLPAGTNNRDSDIEMRVPHSSSRIASFVTKNVKHNLDSVVAFRRSAMVERWNRIGFQEERVLLPGVGVPVSFARYVSRGRDRRQGTIYWIGTVVTDSWIIEVLGWTNGIVNSQEGIESVVRSLSLVTSGSES